MDRLSVGMHVEIMRSDGRVHGALVTQLRHEANAVSVEWFEKGETKGKEIDLGAIMRNNPMLFQQAVSAVLNNTVNNHNINNEPTGIFNSRATRCAIQKTKEEAIEKQISRESLGNINNRAGIRRSVLPPPTVLAPILQQQVIPPTTNVSLANENTTTFLDTKNKRRTQNVSRIPPSRTSRISSVALETRVVESKELSPVDDEFAPIPKSQVVSKIEELEKNREQRRVQQTEVKKQREIQKNIDPGNPNWQFLSMIRDYQAQVDYKPLKISDSVIDNRICVCVRKRPINKKELVRKEIEIITIPNKDHIIVHQPQQKVDLTKYLENQIFRFDYTFDENTSNEMVYKFTAQPLVQTIFQSGFATCFAYGQTGSGKTHTMGGIFDGKTQNCANGIYALTAIDVFKMLNSPKYRNQKLSVSCSFFEIYGAKVFDLLGKKAKLRVLEDGKKLVQVVGLKEIIVDNYEDVLQLIKQGSDQRTAGQTSANSNSSRSHAVFQIVLRKREGNHDNLYGKFSLIDLAGNERGADTISSDRQTRLEGAEINKSLLALKECIRAMGRDVQHVPFRGSKLTLILRDSFVGKNAKTCMIAMISPGMSCVENTLNTLRYADRVKELGSENGVTPSALTEDDFFVNSNENNSLNFHNEYDDNDTQDLQMLHQRNIDTMSAEAYKYQIAVENMNKAEELAIDEHQSFYDKLHSSINTIANRLEETNLVEYDMENYARNSLKDLCEILNSAAKCKATFEKLIARIIEEQEFSKK